MKQETLFVMVARRLMRCPAVAYHEGAVAGEVRRIAAEHGLGCTPDRWGNLQVKLGETCGPRPLVLVAHMDHPGFEIQSAPSRSGAMRAAFLGGVGDPWFKTGIRLRLMPGALPAKLGRRLKPKSKTFELVSSAKDAGDSRFAVWELDDFKLRGRHIHGRACDDLIGVAAILCTLVELKRRRMKRNVIGLITRAEEVGFQGALAMVSSRSLPSDALLVSLETSREMPPVKMGRGPVIRVGDRASVFGSRATRYFTEVGAGLQKHDKSFRFQRALMSGGTCEGTVFEDAGFETAALCVALGNYHNCGPRHRIAAEFVNRSDAEDMVRLLLEAGRCMPEFDRITGRLGRRLDRLRRIACRRLAK